MRKSINVETVFGTLTKEVLAKGWKARIGDWLSYLSNSAFGSEQWKMYETAIKADIEFAKANIELLSEEDYNWLLEQQKSPTDIIELPPKTHGVRETYNKSDTEIMDKFKSVLDKCATKNVDKFKSNNVALNIALAADKLKVGDAVATESQSTRWIVQITIGKDIYYRTLKTKNRMSPSIYDAKCYVSENAAKQAIVSVVAENASDSAMYFWAIAAKEVLCTETSSRTVELVKPVDSAVKKVRKSKKVYLIQDKKTKQYVTYVDHHNLELTKYISEARLYTSMGNADSDCKYLSRYKDTNCKVQLEVVEMPDDEKFVLLDQARNNKEYFVRIGSTGVEITKNIDEAARYVSYKSASTAVKKTDKELPYRFSIAPVKNVKPLVLPVEKPVKKVKEPKVKEEWVLYINGMNGVPWYYNGEINVPSYYSTTDLKDAVKFSSYGAATKAKCKLIKAGFITLDVANVEDCK